MKLISLRNHPALCTPLRVQVNLTSYLGSLVEREKNLTSTAALVHVNFPVFKGFGITSVHICVM